MIRIFELKKLNVHRIVATEREKALLISQGFEEVINESIKEDTKGEEKEEKKDEGNKTKKNK